ncbi:hypothetical protein [Pedobacter heparinus]|uniref:VOC family protein n=1 Tax=Pedobacter heparinus TaxID=984 RepID=UPI00292E6B5F|nr:hypothetical protein [Pedobacter heparinus]
MDFHQSYKVIFVNCEETSLKFFTDIPGFRLYERIAIEGKQCPILQLSNGDFMMLVEKEVVGPDTVVLKTDDCLRDYHLFRKKNIATLSRPRYVDNGLELCFSDPTGNQFVILEERDYKDA